jgi:hypothetical protein
VLAAVVAAIALVLAGGVYLAVAGFGSSTDDAGSGAAVGKAAGGGGSNDEPGVTINPSRVGPLHPVSVTATCQAPPGVDSAGNPVSYEPELTLDSEGATAWRCPGSAVGQQLVYDFGTPVTLASVALVPGYAKVDPVDGSDRFTENRTVTAVVWMFDYGAPHEQAIASPSPAMAESELSTGVVTRQVVLEIAGTGNPDAVRDFTAISDVHFTGYR